jgi:hypothetical protein
MPFNNKKIRKSTIQLAEFDNVDFTVQQFVKKVDDEFNKFYHHQDYGKLVRDRGKNREIKKFIEEILPLQKYLIFRREKGMISESIKWRNGSQKGDATLNANETIEITVAEHKNEYIVREHMNRGEPTFCAEGASKQNGITSSIPAGKSIEDRIRSHTDMIVNAINRKIEKYDKIDSLVIFLNQDGLLMEGEFIAVVENVKAIIPLNNINNIFIWSFQYQAFVNNNDITLIMPSVVKGKS